MDNQPAQSPLPQVPQQPIITQPQQVETPKSKHSKLLLVIILIALILIVGVGFGVYSWQHGKVTDSNTKVTNLQSQISSLRSQVNKLNNQTSTQTTGGQHSSQKYLTISAWNVRVPQPSGDTLSVSNQTCAENGDATGDTVNLGCQVTVNSKDLANSVGSCTAKVSGTVGYFYRMGANDNYNDTGGGGYTPVAQWAAQNQGQYTQIGSYYYAFAEIGKATGVTGAAVADSNEMNGTYTGCSAWQSEYNTVEKSVQALASKFEAVPQT